MRNGRRRVVVTGLGVVAANGVGLEAFREALRAGRSVVVDDTNVSPEQRAPLFAAARAHDARVVVYLFTAEPHECVARNAQRKRHVVVRMDVDDAAAISGGLLDQPRQLFQLLRPDDDVDRAIAAQHPLAFLLRDATHDRDPSTSLRAGACPRLANFAKPRVHLLRGPLAHAARVDDHEIGVALVGCRYVAVLLEQAGDALGVVDVHLTSERLDEVLTRHDDLSLSLRSPLGRFRLLPLFRCCGGLRAAPGPRTAPAA